MKIKLISLFLLLSNLAFADSVHLGMVVNYETAMSHIEKKDLAVIDILFNISNYFPKGQLLISGHTDIVGSYEINLELSKGRAEVIKSHLISKGLAPNRITTKWFSYDAPIASNKTKDGRAKNRRSVATFYNLSADEATTLVDAIKNTKRFYVIAVENQKVTDYISTVSSNPELKNISEEPETTKSDISPKSEEESLKNQVAQIDKPIETKKIISKSKPTIKRYFISLDSPSNQINAERPGFVADWVTDSNLALSSGLQYQITAKNWLGVSLAYEYQTFKDEENPFYTSSASDKNLFHFSVIHDFDKNEIWNLNSSLNYKERNFLYNQGLNVEILKNSYFSLDIGTKYKFFNKKNHSSNFKLNLEYPFVVNDDAGSKGLFGFNVGFDWNFKNLIKSHDFDIELYYGSRFFENNQIEQKDTFYGLKIKLKSKKWF